MKTLMFILAVAALLLSALNMLKAVKEENYHSASGWLVACIWIIIYMINHK